MRDFQWQLAGSVRQAAASVNGTTEEAMIGPEGQTPGRQAALIKAGGVDLLDLMKNGLVEPERLVDISRLPGLNDIVEEGGGRVRIGALATLARVAGHAELQRSRPALSQAAGEAASPQIRNRATLGGNLLQRPRCWYLRSPAHHCRRKGGPHCYAFEGDNRYHAVFGNDGCAVVHASTPATALVAYGAEIELAGADGRCRRTALEEFLRLPGKPPHRDTDLTAGEILTSVWLPAMPPTARSIYLEVGERAAFDWPLASVAVVLDIDQAGICRAASVVLGAVAPVPWRAREAEALLAGVRIDEASAGAAASAALNGATPLSDNAYKLPLVAALVRRAILAAAALAEDGAGQ